MQPDNTGEFVDPGYQPPPATRPPDPAERREPYPYAPAYPGYFGPPPGPPPMPMPPAPRRRRRGLIVGLSLSAVVAISVLVSLAVSHYNSSGRTYDNGSPGHRLRVPDASGRYTRMTGPDADRLLEQTKDELLSSDPTYRDLFATAKVGIYSRPGLPEPALVFIGFAGADDWTTQQQLNAQPAALVLDDVFAGAGVTDPTDVDAGPLHGVMRCADELPSRASVDLCVWADRSSLGLVLMGKAPNREPAASIVRQFRGDAES